MAYTGWGCASINGLDTSTGDPGSGGSGYICDKNKNAGKACFAVPKGKSIAIKFPYGSYEGGNAILGDVIAVYEGIQSLGSVCKVAYSPYIEAAKSFFTGALAVSGSTSRYDSPQALAIGNQYTDPKFQGANGKTVFASYAQGKLTKLGSAVYLQGQIPVYGTTRSPGPEFIYKTTEGVIQTNQTITTSVPVTLSLAQVNPETKLYAKCVCGSETTIQQINPPDKLIVDGLCTCTFFVDPPPVGFTSTVTFPSTKSDGSVETDSGVVIAVEGKDGALSTTTSLYPKTGIIATTTFPSTKADGSVETDS
ncbi:hypothetical protein OXX79_013382, partial [Metschnikowia pulcherrima]